MDEPVTIGLNNQQNSQNFAFLREEGLNVIRRLAPDTWTDHNLHDPGITLLEALTYAITETGLAGSIDMRDLVTSSEKLAPQEFFTAAQVLPSSPVSLEDFQKVLMDHPLVKRAWISTLYGEPLGRLSVLLEFQKDELNSNVIKGSVIVSGETYNIDIALPYWDDPEVLPLLENVTIQTINFTNPLSPWQLIESGEAYFTRINVDYQPAGGGTANFEAWVVMQITTPVADPVISLPLILQEAAALLQLTGDNTESDQTILKQFNRRISEAYETSRIIRRYIKSHRNLCEVFAGFTAVRIQEVAIAANIEVSSETNIENLAADIFFAVDEFIAPEFIPVLLDALQEAGADASTIFDGPLPSFGFLPDEVLNIDPSSNKLFVSDIIRLIIQLRKPGATDIQAREDITSRSIVAIRNLSLSLFIDNRVITSDAKDCLQLINSIRHIPRLNTGKCKLTFIRNNEEVNYNEARTIALFEQKKSAINILPEAGTPDIPLPGGVVYPIGEYFPVQNSLPLTYGVGINGLPVSATPLRRAKAKQLKGYLFFYEQILANHFAQLANLNDFFSARPAIKSTLFQHTLYNLPEASDLFVGFDPAAQSFEDFQADSENSYRTVLNSVIENENQFLDRRNRMLDHLLSRLGESMDDLSAIAYRESYDVPNAATLDLNELLKQQEARRVDTAYRLLKEKSNFYYDLPFLHQHRLQSFGSPAWKKKNLIVTQQIANGFGWRIRNHEGNFILQQSDTELTESAARLKAEEVLILATSVDYFSAVPEGAVFRVVLKNSENAGPSGQSMQTFTTLVDAENAILPIRDNITSIWIDYNLSALEAKLYHLLEIKMNGFRRPLLTPVNELFEIFDDTISTKKIRLRQDPGASGNILLESENNYPDNNEAEAAINATILTGLLSENYITDQPVSGPFEIRLLDDADNIIARSASTFLSSDEAVAAAEEIRHHLYQYYSAEGFYMIEHILLSPVASGDEQLSITDSENPCQPVLTPRKDPYSFQITFVFPSGYEQNFDNNALIRQPAQPDRFRNKEYRTYAESTIRKTCPGHIFPTILWIDRALPGVVLPADTPSFDNFETLYREWLAAYFTDEIPEIDLGIARNNLVNILNIMYAGAV